MNIQVLHIDNLELLKSQADNSVNMIYSDILYGTGRDFGDYVDLRPIRTEIEEHYAPRLEQMQRVLATNGTLYFHTGQHIAHWIRCLLDDYFGTQNFRNQIIWAYNSAPRKKDCFGNRHDVIYRYTKSDQFTFNPIREPYSPTAPRGYAKEKYYHPEGKVIGDVWNINILGQRDKSERVGYPTQKPVELIQRMILSSTNPGDLVADYYLGSGTTAIAAFRTGRDFIGCDISERAVQLTQQRLELEPKKS
jgi:DNA modification methylase